MAKRTMAENETFYRELFAEQARSGLSLRAFATSRGIPAGTLSSWKHLLKRRDAERANATDPTRAATQTPAFIPVTIAPERAPEAHWSTTGTIYEVVLGRDRVLRVPSNFDEARVAALVRAVSSC